MVPSNLVSQPALVAKMSVTVSKAMIIVTNSVFMSLVFSATK